MPGLLAAHEEKILSDSEDMKPLHQNSSEMAYNASASEMNSSNKVFSSSELPGVGVFTSAELLYWKAQQQDMGYAVRSQSTSSIFKGKESDPRFRWNAGFRVGLGYYLSHDRWDLVGSYTQLKSQTNSQVKAPYGAEVLPTWSAASSASVNAASANWNIHLQLGDLEIGKDLVVSDWLKIRCHLGVRGAWIFQKYTLEYQGGAAFPGDQVDDVEMKSNFFGVGSRIGADGLWGIFRGLSIFSNGSMSLLSGFFTVNQNEQLQGAISSFLNISSNPQSVITLLDLSLGFQYDAYFKSKKMHLGSKLGYEFNYIFNQNQFMRFSSVGSGNYYISEGDLSFMGLTAGLRFDF